MSLIQVIKAGVETTCKCHGVSGSCTVQTCWRQLLPFHEIGKQLKQRYETSIKVGSSTNEATGEGEISTGRSTQQQLQPLPGLNDQIPRTMDLLHIEDSPSFCRPSKYSSGTAARKCYKDKNCDAICCGRGHNTQSREVTRPCQCQVRWCCYVECKQCTQREEVYTCKGWIAPDQWSSWEPLLLLHLLNGVLQEEQADKKAISTLRGLCRFGLVESSVCLMFGVCRQVGQFEDFFFSNHSFALQREVSIFLQWHLFTNDWQLLRTEHQNRSTNSLLGLNVVVAIFFSFFKVCFCLWAWPEHLTTLMATEYSYSETAIKN